MTENPMMAESIFLCLLTGAALGLLYLLCRAVKLAIGFGKIGEAILDILFCAAGAIVFFLVALAMDKGRIRFFQVAFQLAGFTASILALGPFVVTVSKFVNIIFKRFSKFLSRKIRVLRPKTKKKPKKPPEQNQKQQNKEKVKNLKKRLDKLM